VLIGSASSVKDDLLFRIAGECKKLLSSSKGVVVGVSGGADSMALLSLMSELCEEWSVSLTAAHFNHQLRLRAQDESKIVAAFCRDRSISYREGVPNQRFTTGNLEDWARRVRYQFLEEVRRDVVADWILTAHTKNDVVETFLIKAVSHKEITSIEQCDERRKVFRPFLKVTRSEIEAFLTEYRIEWVVDDSNYDLSRLRNKVRHLLIPFLTQEFGEHLPETLAQTASSLAEDINALRHAYAPNVERCSELTFGTREWIKCLRAELATLPDAARWRFVEEVLLVRVGFKIGRRSALRAVSFLDSTSARLQLPGNVSLVRKAGGIIVEKTTAGAEKFEDGNP
jgi:tRNA(Ile)-lysidine synthetase-like protein